MEYLWAPGKSFHLVIDGTYSTRVWNRVTTGSKCQNWSASAEWLLNISEERYYRVLLGNLNSLVHLEAKKRQTFKRNEKSPVDLLSEIIDEAYLGKSVEAEAFVFLVAMHTNE
jgi:hypothetical protein